MDAFTVGCRVKHKDGGCGSVDKVFPAEGKIKVNRDDGTSFRKQSAGNFTVVAAATAAPVAADAVAAGPTAVAGGSGWYPASASADASSSDADAPWYADKDRYFPPPLTERTVRLCADEVEADEEAREHPSLVRNNADGKKSTPHEDESHRIRMTSKGNAAGDRHIEACWALCRDRSAVSPAVLPTRWVEKGFRVDAFGNVVAAPGTASNLALCKFDVDHVFPWSLGGRSVQANFHALQWDANRRVKSDRPLRTIARAELQVGLSIEQLCALMDHVQTLEPPSPSGRSQRSNIHAAEDMVCGWLLHGPRKGEALSNFQAAVGGSTDGALLYKVRQPGSNTGRHWPRACPRVPPAPPK